jgi:MinD superfamily P-loop ATPase
MELVVVSGKGGTGKSCVSAAFSTLQGSVVLADCDVDAANMYLIFNPENTEETAFAGSSKAVINNDKCTSCGVCELFCRFGAISTDGERILISELSCDGCRLCERICPEKAISMIYNDKSRMYTGTFRSGYMVYGRLAPGEENSGKLVNMVRSKAKALLNETGLNTIIIDGPPGIGCPVISSITGVDKVVIVTEPSISGFNDLVRVAGIVKKFDLKACVIINKYDLNCEVTQQIEDWCRWNGLTVAGNLPFDQRVTKAMVQSKSIIEYAPEAPVSKALRSIWNRILTHEN